MIIWGQLHLGTRTCPVQRTRGQRLKAMRRGHRVQQVTPSSSMYAVPLLGDSVHQFKVQTREIFKQDMNVQATELPKGIC